MYFFFFFSAKYLPVGHWQKEGIISCVLFFMKKAAIQLLYGSVKHIKHWQKFLSKYIFKSFTDKHSIWTGSLKTEGTFTYFIKWNMKSDFVLIKDFCRYLEMDPS